MNSPSLFHRIETSTRKRQSWAPVGFLYDGAGLSSCEVRVDFKKVIECSI